MEKNQINEITEKILDEITKKLDLTPNDLKEYITRKEEKTETIPLEILRTPKISSLEAIVKYLRENKNKNYKEIGQLIKRNPTSLANSYKNAKEKNLEKITIKEPHKTIPFSAFKKELSILEAICIFLKKQGLKYSEIANAIGKDQRTIWTVCNRANKKLGGGQQ